MKLKNSVSNMLMVLRYYVKYVPGFFFGEIVFTIFVSAVWTLQGPVTTKYMLDALVNRRPLREIILFLAVVTFLVFARHVYACYIVEYMRTVANITIQEKLLKELHEKASKLDLEYYETPQFYTDYVWAAQQATEQFKKMYSSFTVVIARVSEIIFMGGVMIAIDPVLILFAAAMGLIRFAEQRRQIAIRYEANMEAKPVERERDYAKRVFYLSDYAKEIRMSHIHEVIHDRFAATNDRLCAIWDRYGKQRFRLATAAAVVMELCGTLGMYAYLAYKAMVLHSISIGDFGALSQSASRFSSRLRQVLLAIMDFTEQSVYMAKFKNFMKYEPKIEGHEGADMPKECEPLVLNNVSFTYNGQSEPSLSNVSMTINPHEKVAIVGYNGAGKTTLIKLLLRLYDPTEGDIRIGTTDIKEFDVEKYRREFTVVFQDYQIFAATLGENVVMDNVPDEDRQRILEALSHGGFGDRYKTLPRGIDTPLTKEFEEDGVDLSGGERQKIAIARAFFRRSQYAVMDEPSSALDPISEYNLNQNMMELSKDKTVIFISHRLSTTVMADRIYMFEKGRIVEQGSHRQLMELNGRYAEMFRKQAVNYQQ